MLKAVELEIELFCRGMVIGDSCRTSDGRRISRTRAGLGSGLEIVIPARPKDIWVNVPVVEPFAQQSFFTLQKDDDGYFVADGRNATHYPVRIPEEPAWYSARTTSGVEMSRVGVLQGNYLAVYVSNRCLYWTWSPSVACKFCTTGKNVGTAEESRKNWRDVVEVARAARDESGTIFTHLTPAITTKTGPTARSFTASVSVSRSFAPCARTSAASSESRPFRCRANSTANTTN